MECTICYKSPNDKDWNRNNSLIYNICKTCNITICLEKKMSHLL
jgi:hypothetical protein